MGVSGFAIGSRAAALLALAAALASAAPASAAMPLTSERVASGLARPVFVTHAPGDSDRLFIVEQRGTIRILDISGAVPVLLGTPFLDIQAEVKDADNEQGLLGLAFHPQYASNGFFYVYYTDSSNAAKLARFAVSAGDPDDADESSETVLLTIPEPQTNHNGGWLAFGPSDGYLYIGVGDGGGAGDDDAGHSVGLGNGQDVTKLLGKLLRIDVDGSDGPGGLYGIPPDNPFVGVTGADEIWAYGLRNPWRNAFDRDTGDLYIADVGQGAWEEIDYQPWTGDGGESYGWRCREGAHDYDFTGSCGSVAHVEPIAEYSHGGSPFRCSITGGEVYRGCDIPDLRGTYFYADYCSDQIWSLRVAGGAASDQQERTGELDPGGGLAIADISSFGSDADGELYVVDLGGEVYKIVPDGPVGACVPPSLPAAGRGAQLLLAGLLAVGALAGLGSARRRRA